MEKVKRFSKKEWKKINRIRDWILHLEDGCEYPATTIELHEVWLELGMYGLKAGLNCIERIIRSYEAFQVIDSYSKKMVAEVLEYLRELHKLIEKEVS